MNGSFQDFLLLVQGLKKGRSRNPKAKSFKLLGLLGDMTAP